MATQTLQTKKMTFGQTLVRAIIAPVVLFAILFIAAGRLDYGQGWLYIAITTGVLMVTAYVLRNNTQLIEERLNPGQGMKSWDKWYMTGSTVLYFAFLIVCGLDSGRFGWSRDLSPVVYAASIIVYLAGHAIFLWAKYTNRFFSSVVRIQTDRGQTVCREGPYRFVRHPGYVGSLLWGIAAPLVLGSLWGLIPSVLAALLLVIRTAFEDATLQRELPGYAEFARETRYRLFPGIW